MFFFSLYCDASQKSSVWSVGVKTLHTIESYKLVHISRKLPRRTAQKNSATARISFERSLCICPHYVPSTFDPNVQVIPLKGRFCRGSDQHYRNDGTNVLSAQAAPTANWYEERAEHSLTTRSFTYLHRISMSHTKSTCVQGVVWWKRKRKKHYAMDSETSWIAFSVFGEN